MHESLRSKKEKLDPSFNESAPKVNRVYSVPGYIFHPSFVEIHSVGFLCNPAGKPINNELKGVEMWRTEQKWK